MNVGVLVHGADAAVGDALVGAVRGAVDLGEVRAVEVADGLAPVEVACRRLAETCEVVLGVGVAPWPGWGVWHRTASDALGDVPYWAVETWHGLAAFHDALAAAAGEAWHDGRRVLLTAPDAAVRPLPPEQRVVLRDVAEALHGRTGARPVIAVDRSPVEDAVTPTAGTAVRTLADAHAERQVLRLSMAPQDGPDPAVAAVAAEVGVELDDAALGADAHVAVLVEVVRTMLRDAVGSTA